MNDYKIIVEKKYYAVFMDGQGIEQKVEISKEVADIIQTEQRHDNSIRRACERHSISLDSLGYEGEVFATYDSYDIVTDKPELSRNEKVLLVLSKMKPKQAELLQIIFFSGMTQKEIAVAEGVTQAAIAQRIILLLLYSRSVLHSLSGMAMVLMLHFDFGSFSIALLSRFL